jgi:glutamyl-tRNA synthetase
MSQIITRFAPSPTGFLHIGGARTALFNYIYARQNCGKIFLRIEDTDKERNKDEYTVGIIKAFEWLGLSFDDTVKQSDNFSTHRKYIEKLIEKGNAYISKEEVLEEGQRSEVIRFKNPNKKIIFEDIIKGTIEFDTTDLGDFVIAKSLDEPIFHLSNVIDDITMGITHVIRGEEHISNTPRQILIWEAIGERPRPIYGHIPLILSEKREKISKRKHGEMVAVEYYKQKGYLPQALVNFLAFLGWNPGDDTEIMSIDEMISRFNISKVQKAGAIFNVEKLNWYNKQYMSKLSDSDYKDSVAYYLPEWLSTKSDIFKKLLPLIREKISIFNEASDLFEKNGELHFAREAGKYTADMLLWKKNPNKETSANHLKYCLQEISKIDDSQFSTQGIKDTIWPYAEQHGKGDVLWPLRMSLTGQEKSPDPFLSAYIIGKKESISRIEKAIQLLGA